MTISSFWADIKLFVSDAVAFVVAHPKTCLVLAVVAVIAALVV